jgi:hypothetical protein
MPSIVNADNGVSSGSAGLKSSADSSGVLALQTNGTTAVTISTGQVATFAQAPVLPAASIPQAALAANVAGNGPAFSAYSNSGTSCANAVSTKILFQVENFDTNNNFSSSRFTPTVAGYYQINAAVAIVASSSLSFISINKNGATFNIGNQFPNSSLGTQSIVSSLIYMNGTTDYLEIFFYQSSSVAVTTYTVSDNTYTYFNGFLARSA